MGSVVENIKEIRLQKSVSQDVIADALCVDTSAVSNIENGKRRLRVDELEKIANVLGVSVIDLFTWPKHYVEEKIDDDKCKRSVCVTFEVDPEQRDLLLDMIIKGYSK